MKISKKLLSRSKDLYPGMCVWHMGGRTETYDAYMIVTG